MLSLTDSLVRRFQSALRSKRWHFVGVATERLYLSAAIVDGGYAGSAFVCLVDLETGTTLKNLSFLGVPRLSLQINEKAGAGARASFRQLGSSIELWRPEQSSKYNLAIDSGDFHVEASFDTALAPPPLIVSGLAKKNILASTQKTNLMPAQGRIRLNSKLLNLEGALASLDFSSGFFPRITEWRWGFAQGRLTDGTPVGFNLADGNNLGGQNENGLWIGKHLYRVDEAEFFFDRQNVVAPWRIKTKDGLLNLAFTAKGVHREDRNLLIVKSRFAQVMGRYSGSIRHPETGESYEINGLPGVAEDQAVKW